jgi:CheY-like chemotaxis protein
MTGIFAHRLPSEFHCLLIIASHHMRDSNTAIDGLAGSGSGFLAAVVDAPLDGVLCDRAPSVTGCRINHQAETGNESPPTMFVGMARILVVEDHDHVLPVLCDALRGAGHDADCVSTEADGETALRTKRYDLLICNIVLPDGSGRYLAEEAAKHGTKTLLLTGTPDEAQTRRTGGVMYLAKPFTLKHLLDTVAQLLESVDRN